MKKPAPGGPESRATEEAYASAAAALGGAGTDCVNIGAKALR